MPSAQWRRNICSLKRKLWLTCNPHEEEISGDSKHLAIIYSICSAVSVSIDVPRALNFRSAISWSTPFGSRRPPKSRAFILDE